MASKTPYFVVSRNTMVIVKRDGLEKCIHLSDVKVGDLIKGFDLFNNKDCFSAIIFIEQVDVPVEDQIRFWYNQRPAQDSFIIMSKDSEIDIHDYSQETWTYKKIRDLNSGDILKGTMPDCMVNTIDTNCTEENGFIALGIANSHNYYARKHEHEFDPNVELERASRNPDEADAEKPPRKIGYTKEFDDFILLRGNKAQLS